MAAKKKQTNKTEKKSEKKSEKKIALTFLPILGAADQYVMLLRKKIVRKEYGREVAAYAPAVEGLPMKVVVKKGAILNVTEEQLKQLQERGHVETDEQYAARQSFIENLSAQHPQTLTWDMIVAEGSNFSTLRESQDIVYNDKLIRA